MFIDKEEENGNKNSVSDFVVFFLLSFLFLSFFSVIVGEQRVSGHKKVDPSYRDLSKNEVDVILGYFQLWPQRLV